MLYHCTNSSQKRSTLINVACDNSLQFVCEIIIVWTNVNTFWRVKFCCMQCASDLGMFVEHYGAKKNKSIYAELKLFKNFIQYLFSLEQAFKFYSRIWNKTESIWVKILHVFQYYCLVYGNFVVAKYFFFFSNVLSTNLINNLVLWSYVGRGGRDLTSFSDLWSQFYFCLKWMLYSVFFFYHVGYHRQGWIGTTVFNAFKSLNVGNECREG